MPVGSMFEHIGLAWEPMGYVRGKEPKSVEYFSIVSSCFKAHWLALGMDLWTSDFYIIFDHKYFWDQSNPLFSSFHPVANESFCNEAFKSK